MKPWEQGRAVIDQLLHEGRLQRVTANREWAHHLVDIAVEQIAAAEIVLETSSLTSFQTSYDVLHKMFDAILANEGLRGTRTGGHVALQEALRAQLVPPRGDLLADFDWMRRLRNAGDYPAPDRPMAGADDAREALGVVREPADKASALIDSMPVYGA